MLNLSYKAAYQYTQEEKNHLKTLRRKYGRRYQNPYGASKKMVWYDGEVKTTAIKNKISKNSLLQSRFKCSYCEKTLVGSSKPLDHFIPNKAYPIYSFHPLNLVPACSYCNSDLKGEFNPVVNFHKKYSNIEFSIVHPIIEDESIHFQFETNEKITYDLANCSEKAKGTITLFNWLNLEHQLNRSSLLILNTFQIIDSDLIKLIDECSTYQPKKKK